MNWDPNLIVYACVAKGVVVLAEFNSKDGELASLALKCLEKTPSLHSHFSHTVRGRTYMFLIHDPFVFFGIFDTNLENFECLSFLNSVKDSFLSIVDVTSFEVKELRPHCFQGEFSPVFHTLLASSGDSEGVLSPRLDMNLKTASSSSESSSKVGSAPLLPKSVMMKKKKKRSSSFFKRSNSGLHENKVDVVDDHTSSSREIGGGLHKNVLFGNDGHKARRIWKNQVFVVLLLDFLVCCLLFATWLWICKGFQCISG